MTAGTLGGMLAAARDARGWSLGQAQAATAVPAPYLYGLEAGTADRPSLVVLGQLAAAYDLPLAGLAAAAGYDEQVLGRLLYVAAANARQHASARFIVAGFDVSVSDRIPPGCVVIAGDGTATLIRIPDSR